MSKHVHGRDSLTRMQVYEWYQRFSKGRESVLDNECRSLPPTAGKHRKKFLRLHKKTNRQFEWEWGETKSRLFTTVTKITGLQRYYATIRQNCFWRREMMLFIQPQTKRESTTGSNYNPLEFRQVRSE
ncbi:hypothetical protein TNCV_3574431 [Trichonephila clavipes]|nr:hypothetical protein TNCV_3574431 [Trichonephila clavipes]